MAEKPGAPALDPEEVAVRQGSSYPEAFREPCRTRIKRALGDALGLNTFGVNLVTLPPGAWSAQRHWHSHEDEFVYLLDGALTLITDGGEQVLTAGQAAGFPAGKADGHHLVNKGTVPATYLEIGDRRRDDAVTYPDIDLHLDPAPEGRVFTNKKGEPY
ncbi:MAG: cupin domain-containing protein [Proteobacteria bacterium]|nr:cupin domain-containing protein [Pseudomonadota bacterium]MCH8809975.1 cupin domain-containing protein [Pseudomonadota bacterium]